jgi:hypothetical protein
MTSWHWAQAVIRGGLMNLTNCLPKSVVSRSRSEVGDTEPEGLAVSIPAELSSAATRR